jgi:predicted O-linked N-acetylglucosamine transferase (SPINDLY family)
MNNPDPQKQKTWIEGYVQKFLFLASNKEVRVPTRNKIRVGYLSNDFHAHATMYLFAEVLEAHEREKFEIYTISYGPKTDDAYQKRAVAASYLHIRLNSEEDMPTKLRELELDILVDLKGWAMNTLTGLLVDRVAPIQVSWLGFPGTSGIPAMDYILGDSIVTPKEMEGFFTEKVVRLPYGYQPNGKVAPYPLPTRAAYGLPEEGIVFGAFHQSFKITPKCFDVWMNILKEVPRSILWLLKLNEAAAENLRLEAARRGVDVDRLVFGSFVPREEHLMRVQLIDVSLDTPDCNGHTTTSDALQMGVPVVTKCGKTFASRVAASLLVHLCLPELITHTDEEYAKLAIQLANDSDRRTRLRSEIRGEVAISPIYQPNLFARSLEQAFTEMVRRHREGKAPDHIDLAVSSSASA